VQRVVVASSGKVYGPDAAPPYREEMALGAREPYDVSKACADMVARSYWQAFGLPVAVVRFTNVYGPDDRNQSRLVPAMIAAVLAGRPPVIRSDGGVQRDFLYVSDAVDACLAIADGLDAGWARGEALNAGAGEPRTVLEVAELVVSLAGGDAAPEVIGGPTTGARREWVDTEKLRTLSGWAPRVGFEEGLRRTVAGAARASEVA
jgi:CDP-glucose 4,6-dehydratase